jgi:hypothetical protein
VLSKVFFNDSHPNAQTMGEAIWFYSDLIEKISIAVQNGTGKAFSSKG